MAFRLLEPADLGGNFFRLFGEDWALLSAGGPDDYNMLTVSWGQTGVLWNRPVATVYARPQRYTKRFLDAGDVFALSFFGEESRAALKFCGSASGRTSDKKHVPGLTPAFRDGAVVFEEARLVLICRTLYRAPLLAEGFTDPAVPAACYPAGDYHTAYTGEIVKVLAR